MAIVAGLLAALAAMVPRTALAHEKWFTPEGFHVPDWSLVFSERTALALGIGLGGVGLFGIAQRILGDPDWPRLPFLSRMARGDMTLLAVQTAIALIYMAVRLTVLVPNLQLPADALGFAIAGLQLAIAFSFITGLFDRVGALALLALGFIVLVLFSPLSMLAQAHYAGIALAILLVGRGGETSLPRPPFQDPIWGARGIIALRVLAGFAFLTLGLADKVWNPDLGQAFLERYPHFNVLRLAGLEVSDPFFILAAGVIETAIGLLLLSGFLTRLVILLLLVPFNITVPFLPAEEMIGHLPIFGILYLLLVHGSGR
ncbi:MAG TPA: hypothetical protein VGW38_27435, partial [Chloroflexota bacterium]|nr:hypothetical protein [Chloroflexota bacterium]